MLIPRGRSLVRPGQWRRSGAREYRKPIWSLHREKILTLRERPASVTNCPQRRKHFSIMHQSERVSSTSGNDHLDNNDNHPNNNDEDSDMDSWPEDNTSPNDSKGILSIPIKHLFCYLFAYFCINLEILYNLKYQTRIRFLL